MNVPRKLTNVPMKVDDWKTILFLSFLLKLSFFRGHVSFRGCKGSRDTNKQRKQLVSMTLKHDTWLLFSSLTLIDGAYTYTLFPCIICFKTVESQEETWD